MKNLYSATLLFVGIVIVSCFISSCEKKDTSTPKPQEEAVLGNWFIERIQLRIYYNNVFFKDSILARYPKPKNFVELDASKNFQYCFNTTGINNGTYQLKGTDSLISSTPSKIYRWQILTLTDVLFTVKSTSTNDPAFPGAKVETYHTLVK
jgi:hypothetical protein